MSTGLSLEEYLSLFDDKERYKERLANEAEAGKACFVAASCPKCYRQIKFSDFKLAYNRKWPKCKCKNSTISSTEVIEAHSPRSWDITTLVYTEQLKPKW